MIRRLMFVALAAALVIPAAGQQSSTKKAGDDGLQQRIQELWQAWSSKDLSKAATFYSKDPDAAFFDVAPTKYDGWAEYEAGAKAFLESFPAISLKLNNDLMIHRQREWAWVTATVTTDLVNKEGKHENPPLRWTSIWKKQGGKWIVQHEHVSAPMQ